MRELNGSPKHSYSLSDCLRPQQGSLTRAQQRAAVVADLSASSSRSSSSASAEASALNALSDEELLLRCIPAERVREEDWKVPKKIKKIKKIEQE
jgi:hypothetical protein